jgi:hypothetical protein
MAALSTIALVAGAAAAVGGTTYSVVQGERANNLAANARRRQQKAQEEAMRIQSIERTRAVAAEQKQSRPTPGAGLSDIDSVLANDLTGGTARDRLRLSRRSTLGGG